MKHVGRKTTVTVRDREVRRDQGIILKDDPVFAKTPPEIFLASNKTDVI